jgi:acyl-CoA dehydrogenase
MSADGYELQLVAEAAHDILARARREAPWNPIHEGGWIGVGVSEEAGGQGGGLREAVAIAQAAGATAAPAPVIESILVGLVLAACHGTEGLLAELSSGHHRAALIPRVVRSDQSGCIVDHELQARWGRDATLVVFIAALAEGGLGLAVVPREELQLELGTTLAGEAWDRVRLPGNQLPAKIHELAMPLDGLVAAGGLLTAARMVGAMQTVTAMSVEYAGQREQFGRPISAFQAIAHLLVEQTGHTELAAAALHAATARADGEHHTASAVARVTASVAAPHVTRIAHQVHGAIGVTQEHELHRYTLRLADWRDEVASTRWWMRRVGRLGLRSDGWWDTLAPPLPVAAVG